jgi:hypothetical protein
MEDIRDDQIKRDLGPSSRIYRSPSIRHRNDLITLIRQHAVD